MTEECKTILQTLFGFICIFIVEYYACLIFYGYDLILAIKPFIDFLLYAY